MIENQEDFGNNLNPYPAFKLIPISISQPKPTSANIISAPLLRVAIVLLVEIIAS
jgi:hypothetical protein